MLPYRNSHKSRNLHCGPFSKESAPGKIVPVLKILPVHKLRIYASVRFIDRGLNGKAVDTLFGIQHEKTVTSKGHRMAALRRSPGTIYTYPLVWRQGKPDG